MFSWYSKTQLLLSASVLLTLATVVVLGPVHLMGMETNKSGQMDRCIFTVNVNEVCIMSISEHLRAWVSLFNVIPHEIIKTFLMLMSLFILYFLFKRNLLSSLPKSQLPHRFRIYSWPDIFLLTPLRLAFAEGILNPKIF